MDDIDLEKDEWSSDRKSKYPKKLWFGLTDYGPEEFNAKDRIIYALGCGAVAFAIGLYQLLAK